MVALDSEWSDQREEAERVSRNRCRPLRFAIRRTAVPASGPSTVEAPGGGRGFTRRLAWSMAVTFTSAWTLSPGRTGAMNFSDWPR